MTGGRVVLRFRAAAAVILYRAILEKNRFASQAMFNYNDCRLILRTACVILIYIPYIYLYYITNNGNKSAINLNLYIRLITYNFPNKEWTSLVSERTAAAADANYPVFCMCND